MHIRLQQISKSFPGVTALQDVDLEVVPGEIHALCGENGAGKSTLMNILAGNLQPDRGTISLDGKECVIGTSKEAFGLGISIVYQHLSLVETLSVAENIFANTQPVNKWGVIRYGELYRRTRELLEKLGLRQIDPKIRVEKLTPAEKQMTEVAKALSKDPSVLILDEPTASLGDRETKLLFNTLQILRQNNISIIYISHRLQEIFLIADRITVLKDGKLQGTFRKQDLSKDELIRKMVGRNIQKLKTGSSKQQEIVLSVKNLTAPAFAGITFDLHKGEILGLSGLVGAGRTEIARAIFGADKFTSGEIRKGNTILNFSHPSDAIANGIAYVPEERKDLGVFADMSIEENIVVAASGKIRKRGLFDPAASLNRSNELKEKLRIIAPDVKTKVGKLSGGNQQKVLLAKWLLTDPAVLIIDEPTHGIDVGAKFEIYGILRSLAASGKSILMISSDLPELLGICDRIIVMKKGVMAGELSGSEATEEKIMELAAND